MNSHALCDVMLTLKFSSPNESIHKGQQKRRGCTACTAEVSMIALAVLQFSNIYNNVILQHQCILLKRMN